MKAVVFDGAVRFVNDYPIPMPDKGEALVRVRMAGICNTDIEVIKGYSGFHGVMGHEFVGIVERASEGAGALVDKRVVGEINCGCGVCEYCRSGLRNHCASRTTPGIRGRDGVFAEYVALPVANLHMVPDGISDEEAVFVEPLAAAYEILEQIDVKASDKVLVLGDGKLGILCALALNTTGALVTLAGRHDVKLHVAENQQVRTVNLSREVPVREEKFEIVVEATGSPEGLTMALHYVRPRGIIVLKTTVVSLYKIDLAPVVVNEITLIGSRCGPFEKSIEALAERRVDVMPLISGVYLLQDVQEAFEEAQKKENLKIIINFQ
jgi:threonine dehydrogenase-like Zn-dependent dehydrogenase